VPRPTVVSPPSPHRPPVVFSSPALEWRDRCRAPTDTGCGMHRPVDVARPWAVPVDSGSRVVAAPFVDVDVSLGKRMRDSCAPGCEALVGPPRNPPADAPRALLAQALVSSSFSHQVETIRDGSYALSTEHARRPGVPPHVVEVAPDGRSDPVLPSLDAGSVVESPQWCEGDRILAASDRPSMGLDASPHPLPQSFSLPSPLHEDLPTTTTALSPCSIVSPKVSDVVTLEAGMPFDRMGSPQGWMESFLRPLDEPGCMDDRLLQPWDSWQGKGIPTGLVHCEGGCALMVVKPSTPASPSTVSSLSSPDGTTSSEGLGLDPAALEGLW